MLYIAWSEMRRRPGNPPEGIPILTAVIMPNKPVDKYLTPEKRELHVQMFVYKRIECIYGSHVRLCDVT